MTLPVSGQLSFSQINSELHINSSFQGSLNDNDVRTLAGKPSGQISFSNFLGKTALTTFNNTIGNNTYYFTIPRGVFVISYTVVGAGGGGGSNNSSGSVYGGGGGGSGGYVQGTLSVTPSEILTIVVGWGGYGSNYNFNGGYQYYNNSYSAPYMQNPGTWYSGGSGTASSISRSGTILASASGGGGGITVGSGGSGGTPNGVAGGGYPGNYGYCGQPINGGVNALGLGNGGNGGYCRVGFPGNDGVVYISW